MKEQNVTMAKTIYFSLVLWNIPFFLQFGAADLFKLIKSNAHIGCGLSFGESRDLISAVWFERGWTFYRFCTEGNFRTFAYIYLLTNLLLCRFFLWHLLLIQLGTENKWTRLNLFYFSDQRFGWFSGENFL